MLTAILKGHFIYGMMNLFIIYFIDFILFRYVDLRKAYSVVLGNLYKTLYNIGARREAEEASPAVKPVLEKTKRSDVQQDISLLSRIEKDILREWQEKKEKLTVLEMRVEESVFLIRDFGVVSTEE